MNYVTAWQMRKCSELHSARTHSASMGWDLLWAGCAQGSTACWKSLGLPDLKAHTLDLAQVFSLYFPFLFLPVTFLLSLLCIVHCWGLPRLLGQHRMRVQVSSLVELVSTPIESALEQKPCPLTEACILDFLQCVLKCPVVARGHSHTPGSQSGWFQL